jgi:molybdopterin molybdotransferase
MAQLSDDCFAFGGKLLSVEQGVALIAERVSSVAEAVEAALAEADGAVLAADLLAPIDLPAFDNSAVDGFAVRHADLSAGGDTSLPVRGRIAAGDTAPHALPPGAAARIFTGAKMPDGADTVFMQEDVREGTDGTVLLPAGLKAGANRRLAGEDVAEGAVALKSGTRLRPPDVALAAALGLARLTVRRPLRVGVLSTGDELAEPGTPLLPGQLYDSNRPLLLAMLRRRGVLATDLGIARDEPEGLGAALRDAAATHDLVLTSGGVSTGEEDHTRRVI